MINLMFAVAWVAFAFCIAIFGEIDDTNQTIYFWGCIICSVINSNSVINSSSVK